jgi:hypothetical protein
MRKAALLPYLSNILRLVFTGPPFWRCVFWLARRLGCHIAVSLRHHSIARFQLSIGDRLRE